MNEYNPKKITIHDVAREAGVSISTVSRYTNGIHTSNKETCKKIERAIERLNYVPKNEARALRNGLSRTILLIVPDICNPFYSKMAKTVQKLLDERGYVMALYDSGNGRYERAAIRVAQEMNAGGVLFASINSDENVIKGCRDIGIPIVGLNALFGCPFDTVQLHGSEGTYIATKHLIELGHVQIGFAGAVQTSTIAAMCRKGYEKAMHEAGLEISQDYICEIGFSDADGYECGRYFSRIKDRITAVCCANDQIALGLLSALRERGVKVPDDISVTGMDDIPYARISNPSLTSVTNNSSVYAAEGIKMLFERIDGVVTGQPRNEVVRHELIVRESVSAPRKSKEL